MKIKLIFLSTLLNLVTYSLAASPSPANSMQQILAQHLLHKSTKPLINSSFPSEVQLGMDEATLVNLVDPNQGLVYTITAAVEAAGTLSSGTISQSCLMQLGRYYPGMVSLQTIWSRLERYGYIEKVKEQEANCFDAEGAISYEAYHQISEPFMKARIHWISLLDMHDTLFVQNKSLLEVLADVKKSLAKGFRVTFSFIEPERTLKGTLYTPDDTLMMTNGLERKLAGEKMPLRVRAGVITGYNDNALIVDLDGEVHQGVLTLRSFEGAKQENLYMSYDYFLMMAIEAQRVMSV